jgi:hypothetical protein
VDAFPLSEALAAGDNIGHSWSSFPQDMQIVNISEFLQFIEITVFFAAILLVSHME